MKSRKSKHTNVDPRQRNDDLEKPTLNDAAFVSFMNKLPGFAWLKDREGRYVYANSALQNLDPYRNGWEGRTDMELWPQPIADAYRANDQAVMNEGKPVETLEPYLVDGEQHYVFVTKFPVRDASGAVMMVGGASVDLTELLRTEKRLREYERLVESSEEMIAVLDRDYRYLIANRAFLKYRKLTKEQVIGHTLSEIVGEDFFLDIIRPKLDRCFDGSIVRYEKKVTYPEIGERDLSVSYFPIKGPQRIDRVACIVLDQTETKQAESAAAIAERKYREIFENAGEGVFQSTPEGRYLVANPALAEMHGYESPAQLISSCNDISSQIYVEPSCREEFMSILERRGTVQQFETQVFRKDGTKIWTSINARAVRDGDGKILYYEGTAQNITERKRAEQKSAAFAALARTLSGARTQTDAGLVIVETARHLFGWDACYLDLYDSRTDSIVPLLNIDTFNGKRVDVTPTVSSTPPSHHGRHVLKEGPKLILREEPLKFDPETVPFGDTSRPAGSIMIVPIKHGETAVGLLSIQSYSLHAYDEVALTDLFALAEHCGEAINRVRAEELFRESERRYRELFENSRDAIYVHDLNGCYISVNRAAELLSGFTRAEILGKHYSDFLSPAHVKDADQNFAVKLDVPIETTYEAEVLCKDGTRKPVEVNSRLILSDGHVIGIQGTARDITDRKRAEEALQTYSHRLIQAQEAERQNIARELHDEIGQILTAVRISLESVKKSCETQACLPRINESMEVIDEALVKVRELSLELRPSLLDDLGLAAALRWYVDRYTQRTGIVTKVIGEPEVGRISHEIETACFRITQEALTNVARHSHASTTSVCLKRKDGLLHLTIKDNGIGFNARLLFRGSSSVHALGLRGMQERALAVRGGVEIDSVRGKGTRVILRVPLE
ncbi:MAG: PAS domain S-box protein [Pyrinomonadaceae bacterium]